MSILLNVKPKIFLIFQPQLLQQYNCSSASSDCSKLLYSAFKSYSLLILKKGLKGPTQHYATAKRLLYPTHTFSAFLVISTPAVIRFRTRAFCTFELTQYVIVNSTVSVHFSLDLSIRPFCLGHGSGLWQALKSGCTCRKNYEGTGVNACGLNMPCCLI